MKKFILTAAIAILFTGSNLFARTIIVKISNIRGDKGNILVMVQTDKESKPVYGKAKPENGEAIIKLENVEWGEFDLSVFHDENDNYKMDFTDDKKPAEGYAMKHCKPKQEEETIHLKLYYPVNE